MRRRVKHAVVQQGVSYVKAETRSLECEATLDYRMGIVNFLCIQYTNYYRITCGFSDNKKQYV